MLCLLLLKSSSLRHAAGSDGNSATPRVCDHKSLRKTPWIAPKPLHTRWCCLSRLTIVQSTTLTLRHQTDRVPHHLGGSCGLCPRPFPAPCFGTCEKCSDFPGQESAVDEIIIRHQSRTIATTLLSSNPGVL